MGPRILYVTVHSPAAPQFGGQMRTVHVARLLARRGEVSWVIATWLPPDEARLDEARARFPVARVVPLAWSKLRGPWERLRHELDPGWMNTHGFTPSREDVAAVHRLAGEHDVTWVHGLVAANALHLRLPERSILDVDDVASRVQALDARTRRGVARLLARRRAFLWRRREARILRRFARASVCTEEDRAYLGGGPRIHVVPNGYDLPAPAPPWRPSGNRIGMIGKFPYDPNREGLQWFRDRVWPLVRRDFPGAELRVVGEWSDRMFRDDAEGCTGLGFVEDPAAEMATWSASIVPLHVGGGTRIKIAEAFARGIPVVSTRLGAFGYPVRDGEEILLADEPERFAAACVRLLRDPDAGAALAARGRALHAARLSWDAVAPAVDAALDACLAGKRAR